MSKIQPVVTKVEKHHSEGKTTYHIQRESGNGIKNTRKKEGRKKEVRVAIGAPEYRRAIGRRAAASTKA